jgi:predicted DNA-binding mobile mystery protein A
MPLEDYTRLKRRRLDRQLASLTPLREMTPPARGWINAIRSALGMSARQLGERFDASPQSVEAFERREVTGSITIARLRVIAEALDGRIVVAFVPNETLERTVQRQAERKAIAHRDRVVHTMRLEAQDAGVEESLTVDPTYWTTVRASALWD